MWYIALKGTKFAIGATFHTEEDAQKVADKLDKKHGEFEVVFESRSR